MAESTETTEATMEGRVAALERIVVQQAECLRGYAHTLAECKRDFAQREATLVDRLEKVEGRASYLMAGSL